MEYQLICMSSDGEYVMDYKGSLEDCQSASANIGSKWFFYPFHFIIDKNETVIDTGCGLIHMGTKEPFLELLFKNRKLKEVQKVFKNTYEYIEKENIECDNLEFESIMIDRNRILLQKG